MLKVFTCTDFTGHWPVGVAAVVFANSQEQAAELLAERLALNGLPQTIVPAAMEERDISSPAVMILRDGDY